MLCGVPGPPSLALAVLLASGFGVAADAPPAPTPPGAGEPHIAWALPEEAPGPPLGDDELLSLLEAKGHGPDLAGKKPHPPILIRGDGDLCDPVVGGLLSGVVNCGAADGSPEHPFVIEG